MAIKGQRKGEVNFIVNALGGSWILIFFLVKKQNER